MRLDKYLKVSRIIKRRTVANEACDGEHVTVNGRVAKASYDVKEGDIVEVGEVVAEVDGQPVKSQIKGVLRGLLADDTSVPEGLKCGDVDPRCKPENCMTASDKALSIGGGVLEAIMMLAGNPYENKIFPTKTSTNRSEGTQSDFDSRSRWEDLSDETFA